MKFFCELKKIVDDSYDIEIGRGLSDTLISDIKNGLCGRIKKFAVVTDSIVESLYAKGIYEKLISAGYSADMFVIPEGEKSKTRAMKEFVEDFFSCQCYTGCLSFSDYNSKYIRR